MIELKTIKQFDKKGMIQVYEKWPEMAKNAFSSDHKILEIQDINHIIFAGMGGSGTVGDVFEAILSKTDIHVSVIKGYLLPKPINEKTLIIITSVSGETVETLNVLENSQESKAKVITFSSGRKCEEFCKKNNLEFYHIDKTHSPRASFVSFLFSMLKILQLTISLKIEDVFEAINELEKLKENISSNNLTNTNIALGLAKSITEIPIIYYPHGLEAAAIRFKNSLQENAKIHVIAEDVVEASHNGIVAWEKNSNVQPILLRGKDDSIKTSERWEIFKKYFKKNKIEYKEIFSVEGNILSKIVNLIYLLDFASIYLAIERKIDPSPVKSIDFIKSKL